MDNSNLDESQILSKVKLVNSRLEVNDEETLNKLIHYVSKLDVNEYNDFVNSFPSFKSMQDLYIKLTDLENEKSDLLFVEYENTGIFPEKIHPTLPINSKMTLDYLDHVFFLEDGGFIPYSSTIVPNIELILNKNGEIKVGNEVITFSKSKFENSKFFKELATKRLENLSSLPVIDLNGSQTIGNNRITYNLIFDTPTSQSQLRLSGNILLRNWRRGFFGWNTRTTSGLKIEGAIGYTVSLGSTFIILKHDYNNLNIGSNGSQVSQLSFNFVLPEHSVWTYYPPDNSSYRALGTDLTFRGPDQLVINFPYSNFVTF